MHQLFATTSPQGPGNSGDIDFSICKAQLKSLHCRDCFGKIPAKSPRPRGITSWFMGIYHEHLQ